MAGRGDQLPKQNRPLVRDGRLQPGKKRTDRTYLRPAEAPAATPEQAPADEPMPGEPDAVAEILVEEAPAAAAATAAVPGRLPSNVRALQHQGVRRRREVDLHALAVADTRYALHELRRIAILAAMVVITLVVLGIVLR
jgi:hypothetical protein